MTWNLLGSPLPLIYVVGLVVVHLATRLRSKQKFKKRYRQKEQGSRPQPLNATFIHPPGSQLQVLTPANRSDPGLDRLVASCLANGLGLHVVGLGNDWRGFGQKWLWVMESVKLQRLEPNAIIMMVDAYDTVCVANEKEILSKFHLSGARVLVSAERNCWPDADLAQAYPPSPTSFKYLNSGGAIGYVSDFARIVQSGGFVPEASSDQRLFTRHFLKHPGEIQLDTGGQIFASLFNVAEEELSYDPATKRFTLKETGEQPCFLHGNGPSKELLDVLSQKLQ